MWSPWDNVAKQAGILRTRERTEPMAATAPVTAGFDRARIQELADREEQRLNDRTRGSGKMYERARRTMAGGVPSSYQVRDPWPIYLSEGRGSKVWDVDGNELIDFHNGF